MNARIIFIVLSFALAADVPAAESSKYLNAVWVFADNVLKFGRDTYGPKHTPLFVDGLNIHTREPVKWKHKGEVWYLSNLASQQNLFRVLDGLTRTTGDTKYKQAAMEAIEYAFENLRIPNGLLYWGNWLAYDAQTENICKLYRGHILKSNYPYYELMWEVNSDITKTFIEAFWSAHILNWSNLDMNRIGSITEPLEKAWEHNYEGGPVFFKSELPHGLSFHNTGSDLYYAGSLLHQLSGKTEPLVWSKRLAYRYVETRNPATGIGGSQYTRPKVDRAQLQFGDDFKGHLVLEATLCPPNPCGLLESVTRPRICQLLLGEILGSDGQQFIQWALEELTAWGKVAYCRKDNSFVPILTDGTSLDGYIYTKDGYFGPKGTVVKPIPAEQLTFWTYALAYRVTRQEFMWEMARSIAQGNNLGDIGVSPEDEPELEIITKCSDPYVLLGFLELYEGTGKKAFVDITKRIGDNILAERFHNGFFVPSKQALYTKFDYIEPLVLLSLNAVINARLSSVPRVWPSRSFFACSYDAHEREEDTFIIYSRTETTNLTRLLHEAAWDGRIDEVKSLCSKGANVNAVTTVDYLTVQKILRISNAVDIGQIAALTGTTTALHYAAKRGHMDVADWLMANGAVVNGSNSYGDTALHYAVKAGQKDMVELLMAKGADVNAKDNKGRTPLWYTKSEGHTEIVELLRKHMLPHDVTITKVSVPAKCIQGDTVPVTISITNQGIHGETFRVVLTDQTSCKEIASKDVTLAKGRKDGSENIADLVFDSPASGKQNFGWDPACGDVNGDGYDDLIATAAAWDDGTCRGRVHLYYGGAKMNAIQDKTFTGEANGDYFGDGCGIGDVNGDGYADVLVGAPCYSGGVEDGRVYIYYGGPDMDESADLILEGESGGHGYYGIGIGVGDINNDGCDDVVVTAVKMNNWKGRAYLYYGGDPMDGTCDLTFDGENDNDAFGRTVFLSEADVNGDHYADVLIQAKHYPRGKKRGRIYLYYGGDPMDNVCDKVFTGENDGDEFGEGNCLIDIDNDSFCDVTIGADCWPAHYKIQGRVYVYWGSADMDVRADKILTGQPGSALSVVRGGYFNDDVYGDILIGAWGYSSARGQAHIYYGGSKGEMDEVADRTFNSNAPMSRFGMRLTKGDVNGDGHDDAIINGFGYNNFQGRLWLYYGRPGSSTQLEFDWDTTNPSIGKHTLKVEIPPVPGEQNTEDNVRTVTIELKPRENK